MTSNIVSNKWQAVQRRFRTFTHDRQGGVAIVFALTITALVVSVGAAVDYARGLSTQSQLQSAVDSAVLAAARNALATESELEAVANAVFEANRPQTMGMNVLTKSFALNGNAVSYTVTGTLPTTLTAISGTTEFNLNATSSAFRKTDKTEIVIALDTTGSMGFGSSWSDAKAAMASLLVELDELSESQAEFYATFFPFADRVNVGMARAQSWLSAGNPPNEDWGAKPDGGNTEKGCLEPRDELINGNPSALTDKSPWTLGFKPSAENHWASYLANKSYFTCPQQQVMGPTTDIGDFAQTIGQLPLKGTGRFDLGLAWAHRLLSPNWQGEWGVAGYPAAYGDRRKIAIFITDAYTEAYRYEVPNQASNTENAVLGFNKGSTKGFENMVEVCQRMKNDGIEVHTIYVNGNSFGVPYMKQCATNETSYYHSVADISQLNDALSRIANSVVEVGLVN